MLAAIFSVWGFFVLLCILLGPIAWALSAYQSNRFIKKIQAKEAAADARRVERYRENCRTY